MMIQLFFYFITCTNSIFARSLINFHQPKKNSIINFRNISTSFEIFEEPFDNIAMSLACTLPPSCSWHLSRTLVPIDVGGVISGPANTENNAKDESFGDSKLFAYCSKTSVILFRVVNRVTFEFHQQINFSHDVKCVDFKHRIQLNLTKFVSFEILHPRFSVIRASSCKIADSKIRL